MRALLVGDGASSAVVTCIERTVDVNSGPGGAVGAGGQLVATNVFSRDREVAGGRWRMVLHQAGPLVTAPPREGGEA